MANISTKELGRRGENQALTYIRHLGYTVVGRNVRRMRCEIDIIAKDCKEWVFIEVKTRRSGGCGLPREAVTAEKRRHIRRAAERFLQEVAMDQSPLIRFDVIEVYFTSDTHGYLRHLKGCF